MADEPREELTDEKLVDVKAISNITGGYMDSAGNHVEVKLAKDEVGQLPWSQARQLHRDGVVLIDSGLAEQNKVDPSPESDDEDEEQ